MSLRGALGQHIRDPTLDTLVVHNNEIYGNIVGYMRVSGIVPPSTAARAKGKKN